MPTRDDDEGVDVGRRKHLSGVLYSDPGKGKTRLLGTAAEIMPVTIVRSPVDHTESILSRHRPNVTEWVVSDWDDMDNVLDRARSGGVKKGSLVSLDSISLTQDVLLDDIWATVIAEKPARARFGLDKQEYGINMTRLGRWVRHMVGPDLFHIMVTAHTERTISPDKDEDGDPVEKLMPWVQGKQMPNKICGYATLVAFLDQDAKGRRILHTSSTDVFYGKNQYDPSGEDWAIRNPTMPDLMERITKARGSAASTTKKRPAKRRRKK